MQHHTRESRRRWCLFLLIPSSFAALTLPYNPTRIHLISQPDGKEYAYVLQPAQDSTTSAQLLSVDLSQTVSSGTSSHLKTLSSSLPFLSSGSLSFTSTVGSNGNITVLAGDCTKGVKGTSIWRLATEPGSTSGGKWLQNTLEVQSLGNADNTFGLNYLNAAVGFSELSTSNATNTAFYAFGGMCPTTSTTASTWTSDSQYSNNMVSYVPNSKTGDASDYGAAVVNSKGPPVAEAGMSVTGLSPTFSNTSGVQTQQQDFLVLGGHTQSAFINMSQAALFSLPQAAWSFLPLQQPAGVSSTSDASFVTPRSGHTAVLSEDGRSIIVYGGWVGDINTPATPQLVTLQLGSGYGGSGAWRWNTVSASSSSLAAGSGIFGHGAVLLPGNVMMVTGGYQISASSPKLRRRGAQAANAQTLLYNVTSNSWLSSYTNPTVAANLLQQNQQQGTLSTPSQKAGVGVGVTFGVAALAGLAVAYAWHRKRSKRQRISRDSTSITLVGEKPIWDDSWDNHRLTGGRPDSGQSYDSPGREAFPWLPDYEHEQLAYKAGLPSNRTVDTTGAFLNIPSPTRGLRKSSGSRNYQYQLTPAEEPRTNVPLNGIHPIVEADEEGASRSPEDPFVDPPPNPLGSHPVSPEPGNTPFTGLRPLRLTAVGSAGQISHDREKGIITTRDWAVTHEPVDDRSSNGRSSPTKSSTTEERTMSSLSDKSSHSYQSARSMARTTSTRSQAIFGAASASTADDRTFSFTPSTTGRRSPTHGLNRNRSVTSPTRTNFGHRPQLSFDQLRAEGEGLLTRPTDLQSQMSKRPARPPSSVYSVDFDTNADVEPTSPTRKKLTWVGSIRKALGTYTGLDRTASGSYVVPPTLDTAALAGAYSDRSATSSPTRGLGSRSPPRRTASDSSAFLTLKRGKDDWIDDEDRRNAWEPYHDDPDTGDWGAPSPESPRKGGSRRRAPAPAPGGIFGPGKRAGKRKAVEFADDLDHRYHHHSGPESDDDDNGSVDEADWDIEQAAAKRDVQVMFTVPKARLRVVNADPDRVSMRSVSEGSKKSGKSPAL